MKTLSSWMRRQPAPAPDLDQGSLPTFADLTEDEVRALYKLSPLRHLAAGEVVPPPLGKTAAAYVVARGSIALGVPAPAETLPLLALTKGQCFQVPPASEEASVGYRAHASERSTVIELSAALLAHLSSNTQAFVSKGLAATSAKALAALASCHVNVQHANTELSTCMRRLHEARAAASTTASAMCFVDDVPELPVQAMDLMRKLLAPNVHSNEIVELIRNDPSLAGRILKTVNSPYFGLQSKVADYYRAFLFLGVNNVYQLVLDEALREMAPEGPEARDIQAHSYLVSAFAHEIGVAARLHAQMCTTIGLLHDIGKTVALRLRATQPELAPILPLLDDAQLGAGVLKRWAVPEQVCRVIERRHQPEYLPPDAIDVADRKEVAMLYLAHLCAEVATAQPPAATSTAYVRDHLELLGLSEASHVELYQQRILPTIAKHSARLPQHIRELLGLPVTRGVEG